MQAAGLLTEELKASPTTFFAPTDAAFEDLLARLGIPAGVALGAASPGAAFHTDPVDKIIMSYHIVPGVAAASSALTDGQTLRTLNDGQTLQARLRECTHSPSCQRCGRLLSSS